MGEANAACPVLATDCAELFLQNNRVKGTAAYTGIVKMDGTSTFKNGSAPGEVWVWVWPLLDDSLRTISFANALTSLGYAEYPQGAKFVKEGTGRFQGTGDAAVGNRLGAIEVRAGTFVGTTAAALGRSGNTVTVSEGATLLFEASGDTCSANGAKITFGGTGAATSGGGAICLKSTSWQCSLNCTFTLSSDASIRACNAGSCGLFSECTLDQQGHTLMLRGDDRDRQIRFRLNCLFKNSAPIVVEGGTLSASYKGNNGFRGAGGRRPPLLKIKARGRLLLNNQDFSDVFEVYEFEPGALLNAESSQALFTANLVGAPTIQDLVKTYTVTNSFTARAADLVAGKSLTADKEFALGANCTVDVDDPDALPLRANGRLAQYVLATAKGGITGKPVKGANLAETTWQLRLVDGKTLLLAQPESTFLILR